MTRKKIKLVWIVNDSARKASLKKRRLGLLKKVSELITLCGVEAFIVIYSPEEAEPAIWPPSREEVQELIMRYMAMPEMERCKKMMNQESYLKDRMGKIQEQSRKSQKKNKDTELGYLMFQVHQGKGLDQFELIELHGLAWLVEDKIRDLRKRIDYLQMVPPLDQRGGGDDVDLGGGGSGVLHGKVIQNPNEPMSWDKWFLDMVHNNEANVGGGGSGGNSSTRGRGGSEMGVQYPHGFGPYGPVDMGYDQYHGNVGPGGMMILPPELGGHGFGQFPHADMAGSGNPLGLGLLPPLLPPHHGRIGGGADMGMHGFYGGDGGAGGSEMGMPNYDVNNPHWPNNP